MIYIFKLFEKCKFCFLEFRDINLLNLHHTNTSRHQNILNNNIISINHEITYGEKVKKRASESIIKNQNKCISFISDTNNKFLKLNRQKNRLLLNNIYENMKNIPAETHHKIEEICHDIIVNRRESKE